MKFSKSHFWKLVVAVAIVVWSASVVIAEIEIVTDGLVSFWSLDKSTIAGDTVSDLWGNNHGTIEGAKVVEGKFNEALLFNGADSFVEIDHSDSLNLVEAATIEFWFTKEGNSADNVYPRAVSKGQSTVDDGAYGVWVADQPTDIDIGFRAPGLVGGGGQNDFRTAALPDYMDGEWHHAVAAYDGEVGRMFFDGEKVLDTPVAGELPQTKDPLHIGDGNNQRHFNGAIDEVRIYNRALEDDEILQNYNAKSNSLAVNAKSKLAALWGRLKVQ